MSAMKGGKPVRHGNNKEAREARYRAFAESYLATRNGEAAAVAAGFSKGCARQNAYRLLKRPEVKAILEKRRAELIAKLEITTENTLSTLAATCFFDPLDFFLPGNVLRDIEDVPEKTRLALSGFKVKRLPTEKNEDPVEVIEIKFLDRGAQIDKLMKHLGLYEKDNKQGPDAITELLKHVADKGSAIAVKPR